MNHDSTRTFILTPRRLAMTAVAFILTDALLTLTASAQAPSVIQVPGLVRDFQRAHPDFDVTPSGGYGHYAGNIEYTIGANQTPVFSNDGFLVNSQWRSLSTEPIAPHLYTSSMIIRVGSTPTITNIPTLDTFDSSVGPYGGANVGAAPSIQAGATMPTIILPPVLPVYNNSAVEYQSNGNFTLNTDLNCRDFIVKNDCSLTITGNIIIVVHELLKFENGSELQIAPGASLTLYILKDSVFENGTQINTDLAQPGRLRIFNLGPNAMEFKNATDVYAQIVAPNAPLGLTNDGEFYGTYLGLTIQMSNSASLHWDASPIYDICSAIIEDTIGTAGMASSGGIDSTSTFDEWYNDVLGTNLSQIHVLDMVRNGTGLYEATIGEFHPIDDRLLGNEGDIHNYFFTYEFTANFVYNACSNQFFEFSGSDDAWMFIEGELVIDLGGVIPGTNQIIELDRLGLTDGNSYQMKFFYAQRQTTDTSFNLSTNTVLQPPVLTATGTGGYD